MFQRDDKKRLHSVGGFPKRTQVETSSAIDRSLRNALFFSNVEKNEFKSNFISFVKAILAFHKHCISVKDCDFESDDSAQNYLHNIHTTMTTKDFIIALIPNCQGRENAKSLIGNIALINSGKIKVTPFDNAPTPPCFCIMEHIIYNVYQRYYIQELPNATQTRVSNLLYAQQIATDNLLHLKNTKFSPRPARTKQQ